MKAHHNLRKFIDYEAENFSQSSSFAQKKLQIKNNSVSISTQISKSKLFKKYETLSDIKKRKIAKCKLILDRKNNYNEENIVQRWNNCLEKEELDRDMEFMYQQNMKLDDNNFPPKFLTTYGNYARLYLAMTDKNRPGAYNFTVGDFIDRVELYFPEG